MAALPLGKLAYLVMRQVSKPVSKVVMKAAVNNAVVRDGLCAPLGQGWHWVSVQSKRLVSDSARREVRPLTQEDAVQEGVPSRCIHTQCHVHTGADILAEVFVFVVAASYVVYEYVNSAVKSQKQKEDLNNQLGSLDKARTELLQRVAALEASNTELSRQLEALKHAPKPQQPAPSEPSNPAPVKKSSSWLW